MPAPQNANVSRTMQRCAASLLFVGLQFAFTLDSALACESGSVPLFSCEASGGKKYIELCASSPVAAPDGFLEYRFGALDKDGNERSVELVFPSSRSGSLQRFYGATYTKTGVYTQSIRFTTGKASYEVFTEARGMATTAAGVRVRDLGAGKTATVACSERPRFYIHELKGLVACDPSTPVGRACIE